MITISIVRRPPVQVIGRRVVKSSWVVIASKGHDIPPLHTVYLYVKTPAPIIQINIHTIKEIWEGTANDCSVLRVDDTICIEILECHITRSSAGLLRMIIHGCLISERPFGNVTI